MPSTINDAAAHGATTAAISDAMVRLHHRYTGRGPTSSRTTLAGDLIVCVMGAALTKGEQSLVADGKLDVVLETRRAYQDTMREDAIEEVRAISGRRVIAFMSNNHIDPDLAVEVFVLQPLVDNGHNGWRGAASADGNTSDGDPPSGGNPLSQTRPERG